MADNDSDILTQFQEFLAAKQQKDAEDAQAEDFEVEIWDEKGRGVRTRRSHAKPFLQSLGIDVDAEPDEGSTDDKGDGGSKDRGKGPKAVPSGPRNASGTQGVPR